MRRFLYWMTSLSVCLSSPGADAPKPTTKYRLRAQEEARSSKWDATMLHLLPDQALLVLIPQPGNKWVLKRLTAWDTSMPKEETLAFEGQIPGESRSRVSDIEVDLNATYAVVRVRSFAGDPHLDPHDVSAAIVLIDLRTFAVVSRQATSDPLLAASTWSFAKNGLLIAIVRTGSAIKPPKRGTGQRYQTRNWTYEASAFALPGWESSMHCRRGDLSVVRADSDRAGRSASNESDGCAALIATAEVPTLEKLPGRSPRPAPPAGLARPDCRFWIQSPTADFALYACGTADHYFDFMLNIVRSRSLEVLSLPDGKPVLTVPLRHNDAPYPSLLANAGGHTWLLLFRGGIKLETYRLP